MLQLTRLFSGLFYELQVKFIAQCFLFNTLLNCHLNKSDNVVRMNIVKSLTTRRSYS